jgi:outer membrane lipoprotein-sorting protein
MKISLSKDQRGIAPLMIIVAVVVVAGIGFVGWRVTQKDTVLKNATPAQKAVISSCEKLYNDKDLCKFAANSDIDKLAYKMVITSKDAAGKSSTLSMSTDGKGNSSMSGLAEGQAYDTISLDGVSYLKDTSDGQWIKFGSADTSAPKETPADSVKVDDTFTEAASKNTEYKKLGKEKCGKLNCFKYQFIDKTQPDATQFVWFDAKDYRMQRFSSKDKDGTADMVLSYQSVKISAPSPTKEFSTGAGVDVQALQQQFQTSLEGSSTDQNPAASEPAPAESGSE